MRNSWRGLVSAARTETAFRQELALLIVAIPLAFLITPHGWKRVYLIGVVFFCLIVELLNTAIEKLADRVSVENDPLIGRVKDMGSAAVGLSLIAILLVWGMAIIEWFQLDLASP